jgi:hypothetical protein
MVIPSPEAALPAGAYFVAPTSVPVTGINALGEIRFTGTLTYAVYTEAATGFLDFLYQYHAASSTDPVQHLAMTDFAGFTTDVTHLTVAPAGFAAGTLIPDSATRSPSPGSVVNFNYITPNSIGSGATTEVLAIHTNALLTAPGTTNIIDGAVASVPTLGPRSAPEPATLTLFGGGLLGLLGCMWRRTMRRASI